MTSSVIKPSWKDYLELCKPKVVALILLTAVVGMFLAVPGMVPVDILILGTLGIGMASGAAAVVNHVVDAQIDAKMARTLKRPVATGVIDPKKALLFGAIMACLSMAILALWVNALTAVLTFFGLVGYAFVYTMYLKRATPQNIVVGGLSGAIPPLLGWVAVTGSNGKIPAEALLLVLIIFVWTPPHFWALAIHRKDDYAKADIPMLPVTHGIEFTKTNIIFYTILLLLATILPFLIGMFDLIYLLGSTVLGLIFLVYALRMKYADKPGLAMETFGFSVVYLMLLFIVMLVDHYIPISLMSF
ncbi:heme o synthase [Pleionea litopenaei]|uniref:Protoheme IX farnesyltransferase n=1 Tax=Pleionea litopenaei TaxID=3070815 RepID=A0AA51RRL6_9GAMM|nr:heme o synthase [Pleionea sp. HL-JVS1]WMS86325.1 heme o synthase [Pleionea sp. HL-JVS1]